MFPNRHLKQAAVALCVALTVAACGASAGSSQTSSSTSSGTGSLSSTDVAYLQAQLAKYESIPAFEPPGPAFNAKAAAGKLIVNIPFSSSIPFLTGIDSAMQDVAKRVGVRYQEYANQGQPSQWVQGINTAIAEHANLVILSGAPNPYQLQPQLKALKAAGIPVEVTHILDESSPTPPNVTALVPAAFEKVARLVADWTILQSKGHANVLVITSNDLLASPLQSAAFSSEMKAYCATCTVSSVNVPTVAWATEIQTRVESALHANPAINYVYPLYDSESEFAAPGIAAAGGTGKVFIVTYNGTPAILKMMQTGNIVKLEIGENLTWLGWAQMDQAMRILTGTPPVHSEHTALRVFTNSNVDETGVPPVYNQGYGNAFEAGYLKLWGLG